MNKQLIDASNVLTQAKAQLDLLMTACTLVGADEGIHLDAPAVTGLYFVLGDIRLRVKRAVELIEQRQEFERQGQRPERARQETRLSFDLAGFFVG